MLTVKEKKKLKHYEEDFAMPKWKYILVYGLMFSFLVVLTTILSNWVFENKPFAEVSWHLFIIIPVATFLYGVTMRWIGRRDYRKLKKKELLPEPE